MIANINDWNRTVVDQKVFLESEKRATILEQVWIEVPPQKHDYVRHIDDATEQRVLRQKRIFDFVVCLIFLPIALPAMALVALAIKLDSKGPVFFQQERVGRCGKTFSCFKFRSMKIDAEEIKKQLLQENEATGPVFKMKRDPRITRVGRIIRKLSLDELPQLFNVLLGDMSLVGPRPPIPSEVVQYEDWQYGRLATIPGVTGLQQVSGRSDLDFDRWVELDLEYIRNQSVKEDINILLKTIPAVVTGKGAY